MADIDDINDSITQSAKDGIQSSSDENGSVVSTPIDQQIKAAQHVAAQAATSREGFGLRFQKMKPPGCG